MKKIIAAALVFCFLAPLALAAGNDTDTYNDALELYNAQKYDRARPAFEDFLKNFPDSRFKPAAMLKLADMAEDKDTAAADYKTVINAYPGTEYEAEAFYSLGRLYYSQEDYPQARENFSMVIDKHKESAWTEQSYYYMMCSLNALNDYDETAIYYGEYKKNDNFTVYRNRVDAAYADSLYGKGDMAGAEKAYQGVIKNYSEKDDNIYIPSVYKKAIYAAGRAGDNVTADALSVELKAKYPSSKEAKELGGTEDVETSTPVVAEVNTPQATNTAMPAATSVMAAVITNTAEAAAATNEVNTNTETAVKTPYYTVQVSAYKTEKWANIMRKKLEDQGIKATIVKGNFIKVLAGEFSTKQEAEALGNSLTGKYGIAKVLVRKIK